MWCGITLVRLACFTEDMWGLESNFYCLPFVPRDFFLFVCHVDSTASALSGAHMPWSHHDPCQHLGFRRKILSVLSPGLLFTHVSMYWGLPSWRSTWMGSYIGKQWLSTSGNSVGWKSEYEGFFGFVFVFFWSWRHGYLEVKHPMSPLLPGYQAIEKTPQTPVGEQRKTFLQKDTGRMESISSRKHRSRGKWVQKAKAPIFTLKISAQPDGKS